MDRTATSPQGNASLSLLTSPASANIQNLSIHTTVSVTETGDLANEIAEYLELYITPLLLFMAVFGNLTAFAVFSMHPYRHSLTAMLYRILAVADAMAVVIFDGLGTFAALAFGKSVMTYNTTTCKIFVPLHVWSRAFAAWVLVIMALERVIGILFPHRAKMINTKRRFGWITLATAIVLMVFYAPLIHGVMHEDFYHPQGYCAFNTRLAYLVWYFEILSWVSLLLTCLLPFAFILSFNVAIICALLKRREEVANSSQDPDSHRNNAVAILLAVSVTFIVLTLPYALYLILQQHFLDIGDMESYNDMHILGRYAITLDSVNHSINILLYCLCGQKFRQCLRDLICCVALWRKVRVNRKITGTYSRETRGSHDASSNPAVTNGEQITSLSARIY